MQLLRLYASNARGLGLILGWGLRSSMLYSTAEKKKIVSYICALNTVSIVFIPWAIWSLFCLGLYLSHSATGWVGWEKRIRMCTGWEMSFFWKLKFHTHKKMSLYWWWDQMSKIHVKSLWKNTIQKTALEVDGFINMGGFTLKNHF